MCVCMCVCVRRVCVCTNFSIPRNSFLASFFGGTQVFVACVGIVLANGCVCVCARVCVVVVVVGVAVVVVCVAIGCGEV